MYIYIYGIYGWRVSDLCIYYIYEVRRGYISQVSCEYFDFGGVQILAWLCSVMCTGTHAALAEVLGKGGGGVGLVW
jgi:hypothetical protein